MRIARKRCAAGRPGMVGLIMLAPVRAAVAADHGSGTPNLFGGDVGNAIWTFVIFLVVLWVLGKLVWPYVLSALQKREEFIRGSLEHAKADREQAEQHLRECAASLEKARDEASAIVDEGRRDAEILRRKIEGQARQEAEAMLDRARREIGAARDTAVKDLYALTAQLSTEVAARVIRAELDEKAHERLIEESIEELSRLSHTQQN
ncbi:MAG: F0F1 ATP synthase subunit B [Phycisphaerae bacterium]|nr:F0F1 ATP synthase subunit B [Phycisphaerae bacterium]